MSSRKNARGSSPAARFLVALLFAFFVNAQLQNAPELGDSPQVIGATPTPDDSNPSPSPTPESNANDNNGGAAQQPNAQDNNPSPSPQADPSPSPSPSASPSPSTAAGVAGPIFTDAPLLQGVGIPPLIVPDTSGAPFMQKSTLPQGTIFIAVGATLGFLGACVLAWRGLVAWSVRRSVQRAAKYQYPTESKSLFGSSNAGYTSVNDESNMSYEHLATANTAYTGSASNRNSAMKKEAKSRRPSKNPANANLFFSPTAGVGADLHSQRSSAYLPAGYYAAGSSLPGGGSGATQVGGTAYGRLSSVGHSPPDSPGLPARRSRASPYHSAYTSRPQSREHIDFQPPAERRSRMVDLNDSQQSLALPPQGRAPSAYLDDLFENHGTGMSRR